MNYASKEYHPNPFGSVMQGRNWTDVNRKYRYGFNGKEKDTETANNKRCLHIPCGITALLYRKLRYAIF